LFFCASFASLPPSLDKSIPPVSADTNLRPSYSALETQQRRRREEEKKRKREKEKKRRAKERVRKIINY
jgi:hypothetical protein